MTKEHLRFQPSDGTRMAALTGAPLASFTRRAIAFCIDFMAAFLTFLLVLFLAARLGAKLHLIDPGANINLRFSFGNWYSLIWLVGYFTLSVYLMNGRTLGKIICRIRIVSLTHEHITLWHAFERALGYGASALEAGFGFFQYFIRPDRRTVHDRIAETIVLSEQAKKK